MGQVHEPMRPQRGPRNDSMGKYDAVTIECLLRGKVDVVGVPIEPTMPFTIG